MGSAKETNPTPTLYVRSMCICTRDLYTPREYRDYMYNVECESRGIRTKKKYVYLKTSNIASLQKKKKKSSLSFLYEKRKQQHCMFEMLSHPHNCVFFFFVLAQE